MNVPVRRGAGYLFTDHGPTFVRLAGGAKASFAFGGSSVSQPAGTPCPTVTRVLVTPPGVRMRMSLATRAVACPAGISLSAVRPAPSSPAGHR
jgi:hypothetical protein